MNIVVVLRQVPDLIEPLEVADSGSELDLDMASFIVNESDEHALEQALLLEESEGGSVAVVALDFGDVDNSLHTAAAKGVDRIIKIPYDGERSPAPSAAAAMFAEVIKGLEAELVLVGVQACDELAGALAPQLALALDQPYVGVIRGVEAADGDVLVFKEFPGAAMARMRVKLPATLGILAASQPPRYVPVSRIRAAMKSARFEETEVVETAAAPPTATVSRLYAPEVGERAEMLEGSEDEIASRIVEILAEKGLLK